MTKPAHKKERAMAYSILVVNGPNLNLLGQREPSIYGHETLADLERRCTARAIRHSVSVAFFQSNSEGELIDACHGARDSADAIIINAGGYCHTSVALRDALSVTGLPIFEVHISNIYAREPFRHRSYISGIAVACLCGLGLLGYELAIEAAVDYLELQ